jgi:hypothetical protein
MEVTKQNIESSMINKRLVSESRANKLDQQALLLEQDIQDRIAKREQNKILFEVEIELKRGNAEKDFTLRQHEVNPLHAAVMVSEDDCKSHA